MEKFTILCIDFQKDFTAEEGICYKPRKSVTFVKETLTPFLRKKNMKIAEIISDYRQPRGLDTGRACQPGTRGYESEIPADIKLKPVWIKCMNSPLWVRKNIGNPNKKPSLPYQDTKRFTQWLHKTFGAPSKDHTIILIGLTADCCVLSTAQELYWRGYPVLVLAEGVDTYSGNLKEKQYLLNNPPLTNWAKTIHWEELKKQ